MCKFQSGSQREVMVEGQMPLTSGGLKGLVGSKLSGLHATYVSYTHAIHTPVRKAEGGE